LSCCQGIQGRRSVDQIAATTSHATRLAVTVEIKTGSRTVISYLLSPLMRYKQESLRER
jgi:membrane fusion protein, hemolysin D